jgi:hypothetical protein
VRERGGVGEEEGGGAGSCGSHKINAKAHSLTSSSIRFTISYMDTTIESNML